MAPKAEQIITKMYKADLFSQWLGIFSQWLGIHVIATDESKVVVQMKVRKEMLNGFNILHGGISYSLADSALGFVSNAQGRVSVSIETSISHVMACKEGDVLTATTDQVSLTDKLAVYTVHITNQEEKVIAWFKGTVYRTSKTWQL